MIQNKWELPIPSTEFIDGASFKVLPKRVCELTFEFENQQGLINKKFIRFNGVEAFSCSYGRATPIEWVRLAYDKVIEVCPSTWLDSIKQRLFKDEDDSNSLHHFVVYFDDGPCYEFICQSFLVDEDALGFDEVKQIKAEFPQKS